MELMTLMIISSEILVIQRLIISEKAVPAININILLKCMNDIIQVLN